MPSIEILKKYAIGPASGGWDETRVYVAGNGAKAVFNNPTEFRMGAYSWDLAVFGSDGTRKFAPSSGLQCPTPHQPWSHDSSSMFLTTVKQGSFLCDVNSGVTRKCDLDGVAYCVGSRRFPLFLVITVNGQYLVGQYGLVVRALEVRRPRHGFPFLVWLDEAGQFFAIENDGPGLASLRFFNGETGDPVSAVAFNPNSVFAYDEEKYEGLKRDSYALVLSGAMQCIASRLDEWSSIDFDDSTGVLKMMVCRPLGEIFEKGSQRVCEVEENWVEVRLKP